MSSSTHVIADVRRMRERFLEGSVEAETLRPTVLESWHRSQALRVHPDRLELPYVGEPNSDSRLVHAAAPALRQITEDVAAEAVTVILTSADGVVLQRAVPEGTFMKALDSVSLAPGYSYAEEFAGTNGIGTALETGQPAFIRGSEHFVGKLDRLACAGAPIRDPISQRVVGVVDLTCWASHSDPVLLALAKSAASRVEERMQASAHERETALVDAYQQQARRFPLGVLAIGGDVVLMNRYLRRALDAVDQTALLEYAVDLLSAKASDAPMAVLPSGTSAKLSVADWAQLGGARTNVVFHIRLSAEATAQRVGIRQPTVTRIPGLAGRSSPWRHSCQQVERCCRDRAWVLLEGEQGSGRAKLAKVVGEYVNPGRAVRVMRVETVSTAGRLVADLVSATDGDDFLLVLADVDAIDEEALEPIAAVLQSRAGRGWIAATTSCATPSPTIEALLSFFTHTVTVPALRHRIEDIEELVPFLLGEVASGAQVRLAPEAMRQLSRLPWPGNVAQLRRVLLETVARQRSGLINADKLPPECRAVTRRKLTQMEALERDAIVRSLAENSGNKLDAALALGMSRATIYRKMNEYGIT